MGRREERRRGPARGRGRPSPGFAQVENEVLRDPGLSIGARLCYALLRSYGWSDPEAHPSEERLAADLGRSVRRVRDYLGELEAAGLIEVRRRGPGRTNLYVFTEPDRQRIAGHELPAATCCRQDRQQVADQDRQRTAAKEHPEEEHSLNNTQAENQEGRGGRLDPEVLELVPEDEQQAALLSGGTAALLNRKLREMAARDPEGFERNASELVRRGWIGEPFADRIRQEADAGG